jgi:hypothetical protein
MCEVVLKIYDRLLSLRLTKVGSLSLNDFSNPFGRSY